MKLVPVWGLVLLAACGGGSAQAAAEDRSGPLTLGPGALIGAVTEQGITSRTDTVGGGFTARVSDPVKDARGLVVIPAGSTLHLTITELEPPDDKRAADGKVSVALSSVTVGGRNFPVTGQVTAMVLDTAHHALGILAGSAITVTLRGPVTISFQ